MRNDRLEILDTNDNVKLFFNDKLAKFECINSDGSMKWLLQYFYSLISTALHLLSIRMFTIS